ncbi:MAG: flavin monoamine oxidase family protein [Nitrososphaerota archaeon]
MKLALFIAIFLLSSTFTQSLVTAEESEYHEIIVIGAGMAGIAAANQLHENGYDVIVLEARDRIGGRMQTDRSYEGYNLDVGASWIHGTKENPIAELTNEYDIETVPFDDEESVIFYDENGIKIDQKTKNSMHELYRQFEVFYDDYRDDILKKDKKDVSLNEAINKFTKDKELSEQELNNFNFMVVWNIEGDYATDASNLSLLSFEEMGYKMDGREVVFPEGYTKIFDKLAEGLTVRFQHTVTEIDYTDDNIIHVKTDKGNFNAKYVISTLPLGVLKKNSVTFSPPLTQEKIDSINKLEMGILNKVYYVFPDPPFWDVDYNFIAHISNQKGHWAYFANLYGVLKEPVLLAFNTADFGHQLEDMEKEEIVVEGLRVLKKLYGETIPEPKYTYVTKWDSDPFSFGSYSSTGVGSTNYDFFVLSKPIKRLLFAGEATEVTYPATVHGAYFSGMREANRISWMDGNYLSPKAQIENWILPEYVLCKNGLELLIRMDDESAACVDHSTKLKLLDRGWGYVSKYQYYN